MANKNTLTNLIETMNAATIEEMMALPEEDVLKLAMAFEGFVNKVTAMLAVAQKVVEKKKH